MQRAGEAIPRPVSLRIGLLAHPVVSGAAWQNASILAASSLKSGVNG